SLFNRLPATWRAALSDSAAASDQEQADSLRGSIADITLTHITAKPTDRPSVVRVTFASKDPRLAALGANTLAELYLADRLAAQQAASNKARAFLLSEISRLRAAISDASLQQLRAQVAPSDGTADELARANQADHDLLETYLVRLEEIGAVQESTEPDAQVISAATTPDQPADPRRKLTFGVAIFGALLVGSVAALGLDRLDNTISSSEQLRQFHLQSLGMLPEVKGGREHQAPDRQVLDDPSGPFARAVTSLRNELVRNSVISRRKSVLLASALPNEGATTTALSLGRCHARAGGQALLIDCDPQSTRLQELTGKGELASLEEIVAGNQTADQTLRIDERSGVALVALGAKGSARQGGPTPTSLSRLLRWAEERYDLVILDGPPVIGSDRAALLAKVADTTILVAHWGCTRRRDVATAGQALVDAGSDLAGIVLTRVKTGTFGAHG
ncbi:MAG: AAA family ATPase, partial [Pseudomonadota bacterium]